MTKKERQMLRINVAASVLQGLLAGIEDSFCRDGIPAKTMEENYIFGAITALGYADALIDIAMEE